MVSSSAIVLVLRDEKHTLPKPLMLEKILYNPAAAWLRRTLGLAGVERFFVVCEPDLVEETAECFPDGAEVISALAEDVEDRLRRFAAECEGKTLVFQTPVWLSHAGARELTEEEFITPAGDAMGIYRVPSEDLAAGGFEALSCGEYYSPATVPGEEDLLRLGGFADLMHAQTLGRYDNVARLLGDGVQFMDSATAYIGPGVQVGIGTSIAPNVTMIGDTIIGEQCLIGPNCVITDSVIGDGSMINNSVVRNVTLPAESVVGPFANVEQLKY